jgi:hypothetical protein
MLRRPPFHLLVGLVLASVGAAMLAWSWRVDREWFEVHVSPIYCAIDPREPVSWSHWRTGIGIAGAAVLLVVAPLTAWWLRRRRWSVGLGGVLRVVVPIALALVMCDGVLRWKHPVKLPELPTPPLFPPAVVDSRYGWLNDGPRTTTLQIDGHDVVYAIDALGDRARDQHDLPDLDRPTIVIAGESIGEALGVAWDDSFAALLEQRTGLQVIDASVTAWAHDQVYLRSRDVLAELKHPIAVISVMVTQELQRDVSTWRKRLSLGPDGTFVPVEPQPAWWRSSPLRALAEHVVPYHGDEAVDLARALIAATSRDALDHGAYPLFVLTNWGPPCLPDPDGAPSVERRLFGGQDVRWVRVDLDPGWEDTTTRHTDARGHRLIASAVERVLRDEHLLPPPPDQKNVIIRPAQ